ncbi:reverse transcriptase domain-containing protein [Tanacetum coccineum]|uniref:Reverse transcriptase domain-containing protein n=1 Tax=Tanacetum coccineum TaxID=301880 RepID=A0ABQ5H171_9ASTR
MHPFTVASQMEPCKQRFIFCIIVRACKIETKSICELRAFQANEDQAEEFFGRYPYWCLGQEVRQDLPFDGIPRVVSDIIGPQFDRLLGQFSRCLSFVQYLLHWLIRYDFNGMSFEVPSKRISEKRMKNQAKTDKTKHGMEKRGKAKVKSKPKSKKDKVNARIWLDKDTPPRSIFTWDDLMSKFINHFFPPSKTTNLRNEISNFQQRFDESFYEAWDRFKDLLRACPHHGFTELHQLDTFYNGLNPSDQDSLNSAAGGNLLERSAQDVLKIIENKSKVCNSRNKPIVSQVKASNVDSSEIASAVASAVTSAMTAMFKQHQCPATDGNTFLGYQDNIQGYVSAAAVNYNQGNTGYRPQNVANQIRPPGFAQPNVQNNQTRYNQGYNQNRGINQGNPNYQAPAYQAPIHQPQVVTTSDFSNYMKANDAVMKNMQTQMTSLTNSNIELKNMFGQFMKMNTSSTSGLSSLPSNTVANPRSDLKAITTRSGISYDGPPMSPPFSSLPKVVEREPEVTKDTMLPSTENIQPSAVQIQAPIDEPVVAPKLKPSIPILQDHQPKAPSNFECLALADLGASINLMPLSIWKIISTPRRLTPYSNDPELCKPLQTTIHRIVERTAHALIDIYGEELTLRVDDEAITFKVGQTSKYSYNDAESINRIDVIDVACEEYAQEVLRFSDSSTSGNPTLSLDHILSTSSPSLTPFEEEYFILEEIEACLTNDSIPTRIDDDNFDSEGDLLLLEKLLNDDPSSPLPPKELHVEELKIE